jgi:ADP-ribose pyrophosphatase
MSQAWYKQSESKYAAGYRRMLKKTFLLPDGTVADYDIKDEGRPVCVLALTPNLEVILAKQFRPGPEQVLLELPGGWVEDDEHPDQIIHQELLEETGYEGDFQFVGTNYHCAYSNAVRHNYIATNCQRVQAPAPGEFIEAVTMPLQEFRVYLRSGRLTNVDCAYMGLEFLALL